VRLHGKYAQCHAICLLIMWVGRGANTHAERCFSHKPFSTLSDFSLFETSSCIVLQHFSLTTAHVQKKKKKKKEKFRRRPPRTRGHLVSKNGSDRKGRARKRGVAQKYGDIRHPNYMKMLCMHVARRKLRRAMRCGVRCLFRAEQKNDRGCEKK
jgi:hypothetical protein